jgi:hypothetical protein
VAVEADAPPVVRFIADRFDKHLRKLARPDHRIGIRDFYTGNFSIHRDLLLEVGLFDESFQAYGNEDGELAIRLLEAGIELVYASAAIARQHYQKDFPALAQDKMAQGRTSVVCALRHPATVPNLRIGTYRRGSPAWRFSRSALLAGSRLLGFLPGWVLHYVRWLEDRRSPSLQSRYDLALDYFYWLGVRSELHERPGARRRLAL